MKEGKAQRWKEPHRQRGQGGERTREAVSAEIKKSAKGGGGRGGAS